MGSPRGRTQGEAVTRTLVWIDARRAIIARWDGQSVAVTRVESEVPSHRRSTGHVAHDPRVRQGGGGGPQDAGENHRHEHLRRYLRTVADRIVQDDALELIGPGTVHEQLLRVIEDGDRLHRHARRRSAYAAGPLTRAQIVARLRSSAGAAPRRAGVRGPEG